MAEEEEAEEYSNQLNDEYVPLEHPKIVQFYRQFFACSSTILGALAAGISGRKIIKQFMNYYTELQLPLEEIYFAPAAGDIWGIVAAVPLLYLLGRKYSLIATQLLFLATLLANEYFYEQRTPSYYFERLDDEFACNLALHACLRACGIVYVVYVVEVTQPALRLLFVAAYFPAFVVGQLISVRYVREERILVAAIAAQCGAVLTALVAPESPYWLALRGRPDVASQRFQWLRAGVDEADELAATLEAAQLDAERRSLRNLAERAFAVALAKVLFMHMATGSVCRVFLVHMSSGNYFYRFDTYYEQEEPDDPLPHPVPYYYGILGGLLFLPLSPWLGRRRLYLGSLLITLFVFLYRHKMVTFDDEQLRRFTTYSCFFVSHLGATQIILLMPGEIFPARTREFGVALSELIQYMLTLSDFKDEQSAFYLPWTSWIRIRFMMIVAGMLLTFLFLPETKDLSLVEAEEVGTIMEIAFEIPGFDQDEEGEESDETE